MIAKARAWIVLVLLVGGCVAPAGPAGPDADASIGPKTDTDAEDNSHRELRFQVQESPGWDAASGTASFDSFCNKIPPSQAIPTSGPIPTNFLQPCGSSRAHAVGMRR